MHAWVHDIIFDSRELLLRETERKQQKMQKKKTRHQTHEKHEDNINRCIYSVV